MRSDKTRVTRSRLASLWRRLLSGMLFAGVFLSAALRAAETDIKATTGFEVRRIAHAGGSLNGESYTNSYQALDANIARGFEYFELDFSFTSDQHLICLHDWGVNFKKTFGYNTDKKLSLQAFRELASANKKYTNCTLQGLAKWMRQNPGAHIVTDVKEDNLAALRKIAATLPQAAHRVIPQIHEPGNYDTVQAMGFRQIIWTLYRYHGNLGDILNWSSQWQGPFAITMPRQSARSPVPGYLLERGIPTYTHTVNDPVELREFQQRYGVSEIYTDVLHP